MEDSNIITLYFSGEEITGKTVYKSDDICINFRDEGNLFGSINWTTDNFFQSPQKCFISGKYEDSGNIIFSFSLKCKSGEIYTYEYRGKILGSITSQALEIAGTYLRTDGKGKGCWRYTKKI